MSEIEMDSILDEGTNVPNTVEIQKESHKEIRDCSE